MPEPQISCPGCSSAIPPRSIALAFELECRTCRTALRVPLVYQANFGLASFVLGLIAAYMLGVGDHFVTLTFFLAFVFAMFLGTTVLPLVPPRLERR
jgi:zinc transporter ZupT